MVQKVIRETQIKWKVFFQSKFDSYFKKLLKSRAGLRSYIQLRMDPPQVFPTHIPPSPSILPEYYRISKSILKKHIPAHTYHATAKGQRSYLKSMPQEKAQEGSPFY